jgi:predicted RNA binding protein YcfA (HicA-like mRNA interferase family)
VKIPRDLSGRDLAAVLCREWGYREVNRVGSHIILQTETPIRHRVSIPDHRALRLGTLSGILRAVSAAQGVTRDQILASV